MFLLLKTLSLPLRAYGTARSLFEDVMLVAPSRDNNKYLVLNLFHVKDCHYGFAFVTTRSLFEDADACCSTLHSMISSNIKTFLNKNTVTTTL